MTRLGATQTQAIDFGEGIVTGAMRGLPTCPECGCDDLTDLGRTFPTSPSPHGTLYCPRCDRVTLRAGKREPQITGAAA